MTMQHIQKKKCTQNAHKMHTFHDNAAQVRKEHSTNNAYVKKIHSSEPTKTQLSNCACLYNKDVAVKMNKK